MILWDRIDSVVLSKHTVSDTPRFNGTMIMVGTKGAHVLTKYDDKKYLKKMKIRHTNQTQIIEGLKPKFSILVRNKNMFKH